MAMESSSSSLPSYPPDQEQYEVFLSFRGEDTRLNFTSHLHAALCRKNILTFIDDKQIERGDEISSTLLNAIERSKISIVIFSEKYATSRWCLDELVKIMECKKIIIPIFYHIDPTHVRNQSGPYKDAFVEHEMHNQLKVVKWRTTLKEAGSIAGWTSANRSEAELVESIVDDVLQKLNHVIDAQVSSDLVGIHKQIALIELLLSNVSTNVQILGIWGMGGVGKTTIADALFKKLSPQFEGCCFIENVREEVKNRGKFELRNKLLSQILRDQKLHISTPSICSTFVVDRLRRRRVLIVLDDISDSQQIEDLIGKNDWFGPGSKIIVTTRNKDVLRNEFDVLYYKVMHLNFEEALHLFSLKAFQQDQPKQEFRHMAEMVVNYAKGLPLALKILGSLLHSKSQQEWENMLKKLKKVPNARIHRVLSFSYEELDLDEQNIFLDIACCLKGETKWRIKSLLDGCGFFNEIGLKSLENKSLISISKSGIVNMHDMIQEMGWQIVREETKELRKRSRLWDPEEIYHVFKHKMGIDHSIESISLDMSQIKEAEISPDAFAKMHNLRLLKFYMPFNQRRHKRCNVHIPKGLEFLLDELRYLRWDCFPLKAFPTPFHAEMLVELDLKHSLIEKLWDGEQELKNLKSLCLSDCQHLTELPNLSKYKKLEEIQLIRCTSLRDIPSSIFALDSLITLDLQGCQELRYIRSDIQSKSLRWLNLDGCSRLEEFSISLEQLEYLKLRGTAIEKLPSSVGQARNLFFLSLSFSERLNSLPNNFYHIGSDTSINVFQCPKLVKLPPIVETLSSITRLRLHDCSNLSELPDNLGLLLSALNELSLRRSSIEKLPASIKLLSHLRSLNVSFCKRLQSLPELPTLLQELDARDCISLKTVSGSAASTLIQNYFGRQNKILLLKQFHESKVSVDRESFWENFDFTNCTRLDESACKTIVDEATIRIKYAAAVSSILEAHWDPSDQFHLLFKDSYLETVECIRRRLIINLGYAKSNLAFNVKFNANCCSHCKCSPFAFGVCWSNMEENTSLGFDSMRGVCVQDLDMSCMLSYNKFWFTDVNVQLPGSRVPRLFRYRAEENRITIKLAPSSDLLGFAFCLVFSNLTPTKFIDVICEFHLRDARMFGSYPFDLVYPTSDTVILCYAASTSNEILKAVKESIAIDKSGNNLELSFRFYYSNPVWHDEDSKKGIKECGVWPIYASEWKHEKNKKFKKKRKRSLVFWNHRCIWQALIMRSKINTSLFKHRLGTNFSSISNSTMKGRMPNSLNEQKQLPPRKKSKISQDIDK